MGPGLPFVTGGGGQLVDAVGSEEVGLGRVPARAGSWSMATSQVMSAVPRSSRGWPARPWPRYVRTQSVHGRDAIDAVVSA